MRGSRYSDEQRRKAARTFVLTGSVKRAAKEAGVRERTARYWCQPEGGVQPPIFAKLCRDERVLAYPSGTYTVSIAMLDRIEETLDSGELSPRDVVTLLKAMCAS